MTQHRTITPKPLTGDILQRAILMHLTSLHVIDYELRENIKSQVHHIIRMGEQSWKTGIRIKNDLGSLKNDYKQMKFEFPKINGAANILTKYPVTAQIKFEVDSWADGGCYLVSCKLYACWFCSADQKTQCIIKYLTVIICFIHELMQINY